jgi:hypothetical protein
MNNPKKFLRARLHLKDGRRDPKAPQDSPDAMAV